MRLLLLPLLVAVALQNASTTRAADVVVEGSCGLDDSSCTADAAANTKSTSKEGTTFQMPPNATITDLLSPHILEPETFASIKSHILAGHLVILRNAFKVEFAEYVHSQFTAPDVEWADGQFFHPGGSAYIPLAQEIKGDDDIAKQKDLYFKREKIRLINQNIREGVKLPFNPDNAGHNTKKKELRKTPANMYHFMKLFGQNSTKEFFTSLSGRSCMGHSDFIPTEYSYHPDSVFGRGDYSNPHNDFRETRSIDFVWNLSKDWDPKWGGSFYWGAGKTLEEGFFHPTFNTLILFLPTMVTSHWVTPIEPGAKGRRVSVNGKFHSNMGDAFKIEENLEDAYGKVEDHIRLTTDEAFWTMTMMNVTNTTDDPIRQERLTEWKQSLADNYLYPEDDAIFIVSWEDDGEVDENEDNKGEESTTADAAAVEKMEPKYEDFGITPDSSILDFLDPDVLDDEELLQEIGTNLRQGKLVIIRDAFKPELAEFVHNELNRTNVDWKPRRSRVLTDGPVEASTKSLSKEVNRVLGIFKNKKTTDFLDKITGRSTGGNEVDRNRVTPTWYKQNSFSKPQTHFKASMSVQLHWDLTKDWDPTWGGSFYWFPSKTLNGGYNSRTFNSLIMYLPSPSSTYAITPVSWWAQETSRLFYIAASYHDTNEKFGLAVVEERVQDEFTEDEDLISLTSEQASYIVQNAHKMSKDPIKFKKLQELKKRVSEKYLNPDSGTTKVFEKPEA